MQHTQLEADMLKVEGLCKRYPTFELKDVGFELPAGYIMGFIGENGAGKTTTIKAIINMVAPDSGKVTVFGKDIREHEKEIKQDIGLLMAGIDCYPMCRVGKFLKIISTFFDKWDNEACENYLKRFSIDKHKRIKELSAGMKVKLHLAVALSHDAKLLILDEPTSGLDPVARDEVLDIMQELIQNGDRSVIFSTHITSDLDKCADFILFIKNGLIVANDTKDSVLSGHRLVVGGRKNLTEIMREKLIGVKTTDYNYTGLIKTEDAKFFDGADITAPNLEDIMLYYGREGRNA